MVQKLINDILINVYSFRFTNIYNVKSFQIFMVRKVEKKFKFLKILIVFGVNSNWLL